MKNTEILEEEIEEGYVPPVIEIPDVITSDIGFYLTFGFHPESYASFQASNKLKKSR